MYTYNNLTFRLLDKSENPKILELHKRKDVLRTIKMTSEEKTEFIEKIEWNINQSNCISSGAFDNDKLVASTSAIFFPNFPYWYVAGEVHDLGLSSLAGITQFPEISMRLWYCLSDVLEPQGFYGGYSVSELGQLRAREKALARARQKGTFFVPQRYDHLWETYYSPGETCKCQHHKYFLPKDGDTYKVPTVIVLSSLKNEYRMELLAKKFHLQKM